MKVYKYAAGMVPNNHVRIRFTVKPGGIVEKKIVEHGTNVGCQGSGKNIEVSSELLSNILNVELDGFGSSDEVRMNGGKTEQGRAALIGQGQPIENIPEEETRKVAPEETKSVDLGQGV